MSGLPLRYVAIIGMALFAVGVGRAVEPEIIAKARARLGTEEALDSVTSIHYIGTLVTNDPKEPGKEIRAKVEMIFQKPDRQLIRANYDRLTETTALDAYEGWTRLQDPSDSSKVRMQLHDPGQVKRLRANTWQSLAYFRAGERSRVEVEDKGAVAIDGVACQKIAYIHEPYIIFYRFFDLATGRLVLTETESGATLREQGEIIAGGIRFPKTLVTMTKDGNTMRTVTLTYEKITVNEDFPAELFKVPPPHAP